MDAPRIRCLIHHHRAGRRFLAADFGGIQSEYRSILGQVLSLVVPLALLLTALGAWLLASLSLRPVERLCAAMKAGTPQALNQRLLNAGEDRAFQALIADYSTMHQAGGHETRIRRITAALPKDFHRGAVRIDVFKDNGDQQTILALCLHETTSKIVLSRRNGCASTLAVEHDAMVVTASRFKPKHLWFALLAPAPVLGRRAWKARASTAAPMPPRPLQADA